MKRRFTLLLIICGLISSHLIQTRIGCLSKSQNLKQRFDTKSLHLVQCNCDCDAWRAKGLYDSQRNLCGQCGHQHDVQPLIFVTKVAQAAAHREPAGVRVEEPKSALNMLIERYRRR